jgi:parallel beta-helix repeat protein
MKKLYITGIVFSLVIGAVTQAAGQGSLIPPGAPAPGMRTLYQLEPRIPISQVPYTCGVSGASYYLTTNLTAGAEETGIAVEANYVTIDLSGFTLSGSGDDSGDGIYQSLDYHTLRVYDGCLANWRGMSSAGILAEGRNNGFDSIRVVTNYNGIFSGVSAQISNCQALDNDGYGFRASANARFVSCSADRNLNGGYYCQSVGNLFADCSAYDNGGDGIFTYGGTTINRCSLASNDRYGINADDGCNITDCAVYDNANDGIKAADGCTIERCTVSRNDGDGIQVVNDCSIERCTIDSNLSGSGIHVMGNDNAIERNTVTDCAKGLEIGGANNLVERNTVRNNTDNYDFAAGNMLNILLCQVPESIDWPASVRFAGTLTCSVTTTNAITVSSDNVTIDLGGHALIGPGDPCGNGIYQEPGCMNMTIRNGHVQNWADASSRAGINLDGANNLIENVTLLNNYVGIMAENNTVVRRCVARNNERGIQINRDGVVTECSVASNYHGIYLKSYGVVSDCSANGNTWYGIYTTGGGAVSDCMVAENQYGISARMASVANCSMVSNAYGMYAGYASIANCNVSYNENGGIEAFHGSVVSCTAGNNGGTGIRGTGAMIRDNDIRGRTINDDCIGLESFGSEGRFEGNNIHNLQVGIRSPVSGSLFVGNSLAGCYTNFIFGGTAATGILINVQSGGAITSENPWANILY